MVPRRVPRFAALAALGLAAMANACTGGTSPQEPVAQQHLHADAEQQAVAKQAAELAVEPGDSITEAAVADIEQLPRSVEDVQAADVAEDLAEGVPQPAHPADVGAALINIQEAQAAKALDEIDAASAEVPGAASSLGMGDADARWVAIPHLVVRAAPSATAKRVGTLSIGDEVEVLAHDGEFIKIGDHRWVSARFLSEHRAGGENASGISH